MVKERLEPEVIEIFKHINNGENFLLSGGAGSGKTFSLVQVIKKVIEDHPTSMVACMTYTNAAVKEIEDRVNHPNLTVTTIHDFLWDNIKSYQRELKKIVIELINHVNSEILSPDGLVNDNYYDTLTKGIQYKEGTIIKEGIISHDEVIEVANAMFSKYRLLCDILKDKFKFIFIDEYQDTHPFVIQIFLEHLNKSTKKNIIGFFGDAMQAIYEDGVGDLNKYLSQGVVKEVPKEQNRRNPQLVIDLANQLRTDGIIQKHSGDDSAPNMVNKKVKEGDIKFIYSKSNDIDAIKKVLSWDFTNSKLTKELNLTHNLIAPKAGFPDLMEIYDKDRILDYKKKIIDHIKDKKITKDFSFYKFGDVIDELKVSKTARQTEFIEANKDLYEEARSCSFTLFRNIYVSKETLIDDKKQDEADENKKGSKRDNLIKHLFKIQRLVHLYQEKQFNEFLRRTEYQMRRLRDKEVLKDIVEAIAGMSDFSIEEVIEFADQKGICKKDDKYYKFIEGNPYIFYRVKKVKFTQFQYLFYYLEGHTPFSTQHKIKGTQFDNVLVILDNGNWSNYNFEYLFNNRIDKASVLSRTQKIFYVCCTRAKEKLAVFYHNPSSSVIAKAKLWFGESNVVEV